MCNLNFERTTASITEHTKICQNNGIWCMLKHTHVLSSYIANTIFIKAYSSFYVVICKTVS